MKNLLFLFLVLFSVAAFGQSAGQGFTPSLGSSAPGVVDSTRLVQDSILQYWRDGVVVGRDTLVQGSSEPPGVLRYDEGTVYEDSALVNVGGIIYRNILDMDNGNDIPGVGWENIDPTLLINAERNERINVGYLVSEKYNATGSKLLKNKITAIEKMSIAAIGDSKTEDAGRGSNRLKGLLQEELGSSGYGYTVLSGAAAAGMNVVNIGGTMHDGGADFGAYSLSGHAVELSAGNSYGFSPRTTPTPISYHDAVTMFYVARPGDGTANVTYGGTTVNIDASSTILEKKSVTISGAYGSNGFLVDGVTGSVTITDVVFQSNSIASGVWFHVIGNGGYTSGNLATRFTEPLNQAVIAFLGIDYAVLRVGTNDMAAGTPPTQLGINYDALVAAIRNVNADCEFTITGLEDAILSTSPAYPRSAYEAEQSAQALKHGANYAPLATIIPTWPQWQSLGYAEDDVHSNDAGGILIGDFLYDVMRGDASYKSEALSDAALRGLPPNAVVTTDPDGVSIANENKLFWSSTIDRFGILTPTPEYTFDLPISSTNTWRLPGFTMTPASGLVWDNRGATGLEGDVVWNLNSNNNFSINLDGASSRFEVNGLTDIKLSDYFNITASGSFEFDNTSAEGDVDFRVDANNDFNVFLAGGSSADFKIVWGGTTVLSKWLFNQQQMGVPIDMQSNRIFGLPAPAADNDAVRRIDLDDAIAAAGGATAIGDLTDVDVTTVGPTNNQGLVWDALNSTWVPATIGSDNMGNNDAGGNEVTNAADATSSTSLATLQQVNDVEDEIVWEKASSGTSKIARIVSPANGWAEIYAEGNPVVRFGDLGGGNAGTITLIEAGATKSIFRASGSSWFGGTLAVGKSGAASEALEVVGNAKADAFIGDGSQLTGIPVSRGLFSSVNTDANGATIIPHTFGVVPTAIAPIARGPVYYHVQVTSKTTTNFAIKVFFSDGTPAANESFGLETILSFQ